MSNSEKPQKYLKRSTSNTLETQETNRKIIKVETKEIFIEVEKDYTSNESTLNSVNTSKKLISNEDINSMDTSEDESEGTSINGKKISENKNIDCQTSECLELSEFSKCNDDSIKQENSQKSKRQTCNQSSNSETYTINKKRKPDKDIRPKYTIEVINLNCSNIQHATLYKCSKCSFKTNMLDFIETHTHRKCNETEKKRLLKEYLCSCCNHKFKSFQLLKCHTCIDPLLIEKGRKDLCLNCGCPFRNFNGISHKCIFKCTFCDLTFTSKFSGLQHEIICKLMNKETLFDIEDETKLEDKNKLELKRTKSNAVLVPISYIHKNCKLEYTIEPNRLNFDNPTSKYNCSLCYKIYNSKWNMERHLRNHISNDLLKNSTKRTDTQNNDTDLLKHNIKRTGAKQQCSKKSPKKENLCSECNNPLNDILTHNCQFKCSFCDLTYMSKGSRGQHEGICRFANKETVDIPEEEKQESDSFQDLVGSQCVQEKRLHIINDQKIMKPAEPNSLFEGTYTYKDHLLKYTIKPDYRYFRPPGKRLNCTLCPQGYNHTYQIQQHLRHHVNSDLSTKAIIKYHIVSSDRNSEKKSELQKHNNLLIRSKVEEADTNKVSTDDSSDEMPLVRNLPYTHNLKAATGIKSQNKSENTNSMSSTTITEDDKRAIKVESNVEVFLEEPFSEKVESTTIIKKECNEIIKEETEANYDNNEPITINQVKNEIKTFNITDIRIADIKTIIKKEPVISEDSTA